MKTITALRPVATIQFARVWRESIDTLPLFTFGIFCNVSAARSNLFFFFLSFIHKFAVSL